MRSFGGKKFVKANYGSSTKVGYLCLIVVFCLLQFYYRAHPGVVASWMLDYKRDSCGFNSHSRDLSNLYIFFSFKLNVAGLEPGGAGSTPAMFFK